MNILLKPVQSIISISARCTDGEEYDAVSKGCILCRLGFYRRADQTEEACVKCDKGFTTLARGQSRCVKEATGVCVCVCACVLICVIISVHVILCVCVCVVVCMSMCSCVCMLVFRYV